VTDKSQMVRVEFEYADGSIQRLIGPPAEAWLEDVNNVIALTHIRYGKGPMNDYPWEWTDRISEDKRRDLGRFEGYEGTD
jgi:hypothetical protein